MPLTLSCKAFWSVDEVVVISSRSGGRFSQTLVFQVMHSERKPPSGCAASHPCDSRLVSRCNLPCSQASATENVANAAVELGAFGVGLQYILIGLARNLEILVYGPVAKFQLEDGLVLVVCHAGQQAGLHRRAIGQGLVIRCGRCGLADWVGSGGEKFMAFFVWGSCFSGARPLGDRRAAADEGRVCIGPRDAACGLARAGRLLGRGTEPGATLRHRRQGNGGPD